MGLLGATSLAVGTMVGASIFSVFGLGVQIAGTNLPLVFVVGGVLALLVAYSYTKLAAKIVSNAGAIEFILKGFGDGILVGTLSILVWFTYVVSIALFAKGFAGYLIPLVGLPSSVTATGIAEVGVIAVFLGLALLGTKAVGRAELFIVLVKVAILGVFIVLGLSRVHPAWIRPSFSGAMPSQTLIAVSIFFLSYMGFGLITNASENIRNPTSTVPRAIYLSIGIVTLIYVGVAIAAVGTVPVERLVQAREYALAEAAKPLIGRIGYFLISIGALFSISSALNATMFGGANIAFALASEGELPKVFERKEWFSGTVGLYLTAGVSLVLALFFSLNGIASITSAVFMVVYFFVLLSHLRLLSLVGGSRIVVGITLFLVTGALGILCLHQWRTDRSALVATGAVVVLSAVTEIVYRRLTHRSLRSRR